MGRGHGVARLHNEMLSALGLANGDAIELRGNRRTYAKVHELYPTDQEKDVIRLDEILRTNAASGLNGKAIVTPIGKSIPVADTVVVAPLAQTLHMLPESFMVHQLDSA